MYCTKPRWRQSDNSKISTPRRLLTYVVYYIVSWWLGRRSEHSDCSDSMIAADSFAEWLSDTRDVVCSRKYAHSTTHLIYLCYSEPMCFFSYASSSRLCMQSRECRLVDLRFSLQNWRFSLSFFLLWVTVHCFYVQCIVVWTVIYLHIEAVCYAMSTSRFREIMRYIIFCGQFENTNGWHKTKDLQVQPL